MRTPSLHPILAEVYRARVASLREGLEQEGTTEVREALRALVSRVEVHADRIELVGELSAMLATAGVEGLGGNAKSPLTCASGLFGSVSVDAGTCSLRCQYVEVPI
ncbi:hypothetical protein [Roseococcus microcysteis]|uniref:hypothetical protein n=1 Tax=Roseococcus microcysteis TaxID=2771361 RepID=UPI00168B0AA9|nr:hypothetical protein [Roseococcus microcysteis]